MKKCTYPSPLPSVFSYPPLSIFPILPTLQKPITPMSNFIHFDDGQQAATYELATFGQRVVARLDDIIGHLIDS